MTSLAMPVVKGGGSALRVSTKVYVTKAPLKMISLTDSALRMVTMDPDMKENMRKVWKRAKLLAITKLDLLQIVSTRVANVQEVTTLEATVVSIKCGLVMAFVLLQVFLIHGKSVGTNTTGAIEMKSLVQQNEITTN